MACSKGVMQKNYPPEKIPKLSQTGSSVEMTGEGRREEAPRGEDGRAPPVHGEQCRCLRPREPGGCLPCVHGWGQLS